MGLLVESHGVSRVRLRTVGLDPEKVRQRSESRVKLDDSNISGTFVIMVPCLRLRYERIRRNVMPDVNPQKVRPSLRRRGGH